LRAKTIVERLIKSAPIDVAVLDLNMPRLDSIAGAAAMVALQPAMALALAPERI